ncbi:hypothetical protein T10_1880 [Trichinella papuae]|uniref:Uncharacterized protein n=1 Tax=Trichinella papuae TaxID=268474 RepID=A0A0V1LZD9_9BILA|nr:hypothetical protein T10_1880 [Trichinella papuae]
MLLESVTLARGFYIPLNCSHQYPIMIKRLRQYLDNYAVMPRTTRFVVIL